MKKLGSITELIALIFRNDTYAITLRPNNSTTHTADRIVDLPPGDTAHELVSATSTQTLTNKTVTNLVANGTLSGTAVKDEDDMLSDSATAVPTQQSVKAYVDVVDSALDTHIADTSTHGVTGDVVGTTDSQTLTNKTLTAPAISSPTGLVKADVGLGNVDNTSDATKNAAAVTLTNKTLTSPVINTSISGTAILDEDNMSSNSATQVPTQQSVKAYVDTGIAAEIATHAADTTTHGTTGAIVGTTDTQVLENKSLETSCKIVDATNNTKQLLFDLSGHAAGAELTILSSAQDDETLILPATTTTLVGTDTTDTLSNKTLTSPVLNGSLTGTGIVDEDDMSSNSAVKVPTQQSVKAYVDTEIAGVNSSGSETSAKNADYTITDIDNIRTVLMTTAGTNRTVTLPTAADNDFRIITIKKVDSGTGFVIIDGEGTETIEGQTTVTLYKQWETVTIQCDGSNWFILDAQWAYGIYTPTVTNGTNVSATTTYNCTFQRLSLTQVAVQGKIDIDCGGGAFAASNFEITLPIASEFTVNTDLSGTFVQNDSAGGAMNPGWIDGDSTDNRATFNFNASTGNNQQARFMFTYLIKA
jgi:hypothetical protein